MNISEGVYNNVIGTYNVAKAAIENKVENMLLISTDKAVRPTNVMGASKRFSELVLQAFSDKNSSTCFSMVRFGNVLDSAGSVVPLFRKQIKEGGPVTVTHRNITRYFMSIPEAVQLVLQAGAMAKGGDVFVLDMGDPIKILDLAYRMIHLSGLKPIDTENPNGDIKIKFTGLRPGEKLYEELLIGDDVIQSEHPRIMQAREEKLTLDIIEKKVLEISNFRENQDDLAIKNILLKNVNGYHSQEE
ncbi:MAG TPA: polysaccharide biosynthesis protein, partial [Flavobacteriales bacterium]|nr:polysaccharide biosynthesis protein [Flavobacteriales bacterium]